MNYQEIVDAGVAYADRFNDPEIADNLDLFLRMGEARLSRLLKVRKASVRAVLLANGGSMYSLPPDFGGMRHIQIMPTDPTKQLKIMDFLNPRQMSIKEQGETSSSQLGYYTIIADQIKTSFNVSDSVIEILYYQRIPPLTEGDDTNWVSDDHPDIYLCLLMFEIEIFTKNYEAADGWESRLDKALNELEVTDVTERWSGDPLTTKVSII